MDINDRIYYTGDMANIDGWFVVSKPWDKWNFEIVEEKGGEDRTMVICQSQVGEVYKGHCNPRFVTEAAYMSYKQARISQYEKTCG
jgi:hypothetical protein